MSSVDAVVLLERKDPGYRGSECGAINETDVGGGQGIK